MNDPLTEEELAAMEERCAKSTDAPWQFDCNGMDHPWALQSKSEIRYVMAANIAQDTSARLSTMLSFRSGWDKAFIENARTDMPRLLAEVRRLREENRRLKEATR